MYSPRRPPWWPADEAWPPSGPAGWRRLRRGFVVRATVFAAVVITTLVLFGTFMTVLLASVSGTHPGSIVVGIATLVVVIALARALIRNVRFSAQPLGELIEASARVQAGQLGTQVAERGSGEVRALARAFNEMSTRLAQTEERRRTLLAEVSHELRTPLTVIQGTVEGMLDGLYPADREHLQRVAAEIRHLEQLIDDLRTLSLADAGALRLQREPADLGAIAREAAAGFEAQAGEAGVSLTVEAEDHLPELELDPQRIHQVIANLLANALRHTPGGGQVTVSVVPADDALVLAVSDTGEGMTPEAVSHAFDRFWRSGTNAGAGLGLAIVRDLVVAHGGSVEIESAPGGGTTVRCRFPTSIDERR